MTNILLKYLFYYFLLNLKKNKHFCVKRTKKFKFKRRKKNQLLISFLKCLYNRRRRKRPLRRLLHSLTEQSQFIVWFCSKSFGKLKEIKRRKRSIQNIRKNREKLNKLLIKEKKR